MKSSSKIAGLWCAVDQHSVVLDVLVQSRRDAKAAILNHGRRLSRWSVTSLRPKSDNDITLSGIEIGEDVGAPTTR